MLTTTKTGWRLWFLLLLLAFVPGHSACVANDGGFGERVFTLYAGQDIDAGSVTVQVQGDNLLVTYRTTGLWTLTGAHLWIGTDPEGYPQTKTGNPIPGKFPYTSGTLQGVTAYAFQVPLARLGFSCPADDAIYFLMAHAALVRTSYDGSVQTETGWSDGERVVEKGNWATRSNFTLSCECDPDDPPDPQCETAFAYDPNANACFTAYGFNRWGWSNGPYGIYTHRVLDLYAGAGQCDRSKGTLVGSLTLDVLSASQATVLYATTGGWTMEATHVYMGTGMFPLFKQGKDMVPTVAPGQYPYQHELNGAARDTFALTLTGGLPQYLIAHAVVCK